MTQHVVIIWMATAVATFSGLVGCTSKSAPSAAAAVRALQITRLRMAILDNTLRAIGLLIPKEEARHIGDVARIEFDAWPGQVFSGHVSNISSAADSSTGTVTVEVQLKPRRSDEPTRVHATPADASVPPAFRCR